MPYLQLSSCISFQAVSLPQPRKKKRISSQAPLEPIPASEKMAGNFSFTYETLHRNFYV
ncbi:hypothetical protein BBR47_11120 [Brevibacillus brevis NBRC 100599]|uniref:Uncharacterized protein n=1 Tax=Brevibacillus brevis (strain 47 / JCM 6285 / NBRC 100599) TaxID=358681 RepID=C0Z6D2_BREBN|nr:hypothetical protein BBR47_11120 [Brevibacillus brevis NBRC 100599]